MLMLQDLLDLFSASAAAAVGGSARANAAAM
jgi:hypothetical protein